MNKVLSLCICSCLLLCSIAFAGQSDLSFTDEAYIPHRYFLASIEQEDAEVESEQLALLAVQVCAEKEVPLCQIVFRQKMSTAESKIIAVAEMQDGKTVSLLRPRNDKEGRWFEKILAYPTSPYLLTTAFLDNQVMADEDFLGKIVVFEGLVADIGKGAFHLPYIFFSRVDGADTGLTCYFSKATPPLRKVRKGSRVLMRCKVKEFLMQDVILDQCEIVSLQE